MNRIGVIKSAAITLAIGAIGGVLANLINWPLPWMVGSMCAVIISNCSGYMLKDVPNGRKAGQWLISSVIGLHFTSSVLEQVSTHFWLMISAAVMTFVVSLLGVQVLARRGLSLSTSFFSLMPANSAEMMTLGTKHQADAAQVAAAHSLRLVMIILIIPAAMAWGIGGSRMNVAPMVDWSWVAILLPSGLIVALIWSRLGLPNAWAFGPMLVCAGFTTTYDLHLGLPVGLTILGQMLLGCSLGINFDRSFFRRAPAFLIKIFLINLSIMGMGFMIAALISGAVGIPSMTLMLGVVPGSSTEMSLTAEALGLGVALVTAMQIIRMVVVMILAEPIYKVWVARRMDEH